jgi:hypothetical protein
VPTGFTRENVALAADETAVRMAAALDGGGLAAGFVRRYAEKNRRHALVAHPARHRELIERINREALLAMVARFERDLPRRFDRAPAKDRRRRLRLDSDDFALANHFRVEFYGRLAELFDWKREELTDFWRDLDLYTGAARARRPGRLPRGLRRRKRARNFGVFADRCAFLLDSSLFQRARRAAARLHADLERNAMLAARAGFRSAGIGRTASPAARHAAAEPRRGRRKKAARKKGIAMRREKMTQKKKTPGKKGDRR